MNIKHFKMLFNRALRVKSRNSEQGEKMFLYLLTKLETILGTPNSYYAASINFELVRVANTAAANVKALEYLDQGG